MLTEDLTGLRLMNPVQADMYLKKFRDSSDDVKSDKLTLSYNSILKNNDLNSYDYWDGVNFKIKRIYSNVFAQLMAELYLRVRLTLLNQSNDEEFFDTVKSTIKELKNNEIDEDKIKKYLEQLVKSNQTAAATQLNFSLSIQQCETKLIEHGIKKYQTEEDIVKFIKSTKRGLCACYLADFTRVIPNDVHEKIQEVEKLGVFDNYLILYYSDKKEENKYFTKVQKPPKDPILFGLILGSRKLYYIADWIDEFCNLQYTHLLESGLSNNILGDI